MMRKSCGICRYSDLWAREEPCNSCWGNSKWESKEKMNKKFKAMKFWIGGDKEVSEKLQKVLFSLGYTWCNLGAEVHPTESEYISAHHDGDLSHGDGSFDYEEINIDWMRTPKEETVELNGKKYLKSELEEALKHIKPMED